MKKMLMKSIKHLVHFLVLPICLVGCTDVWNNHYDVDNEKQIADKTLWEEIAARPELASFANCLMQHGYDKVLDGDQMYTVFAPQGEIDLSNLSAEKVKEEFIKNHVARFAHSANSSTIDKNVLMLNEKFINFTKEGDGYTFGERTLGETNVLAKNGVLHVIDSQVPFFYNIWEYMTTDSAYSKIKQFMSSFDEIELDEEASVKGPIVDGMQTYVDSVVVTYNELLYMLGRLNDEDSTYTMILPTNAAWDDAYQRVSPYLAYPKNKENRDSLQDLYTKMGIVSDLIFRHESQGSVQDSLVSTSGNVFYNPFDYILADFASMDEAQTCSNGRVFVVDSLRHAPWDSWHSSLKVEGERTNGHEFTNCLAYRRTLTYTDSLYSKVSKGGYVEVVPKNSSVTPSVDFSVWNTLAASYEIKLVFLPQNIATDKSIGVLPNHIQVALSYVDANGKSKSTTLVKPKDSLIVNPTRIDTVSAGVFNFPVATYGEEKSSTVITVKSAAGAKDKNKSRTFLIDCVILEPVKE